MTRQAAREALAGVGERLRRDLELCDEQDRRLAEWAGRVGDLEARSRELDSAVEAVKSRLDGWQERLGSVGSIMTAAEDELRTQDERVRRFAEALCAAPPAVS